MSNVKEKKISIGLLLFWFLFPLANESIAKTITVTDTKQLMRACNDTSEGRLLILIKKGLYRLPERLYIQRDNVTLKGMGKDRNAVVLSGQNKSGWIGNIISIMGSNITIQDLSIGNARQHGIQIHGEKGAGRIFIRNVRIFDTWQQMIKGSYNPATPQKYTSHGIIEDCLFEFTKGQGFQSYTGGIDIHHGEKWIVKNNIFKHIKAPGRGLSQSAIHFWTHSKDVVVSGNTIVDCDRGVMFGFDNSFFDRGIIKNNFIHTIKDTGIYLCNATQVQVVNNTVFLESNYPNAIEYRFKRTKNNKIVNNLSNRKIVSRDHGVAKVSNNYERAKSYWFKDPNNGDLHLNQYIKSVIDKGVYVPNVKYDIDGQTRDVNAIDIGADEKMFLKP